MRSPVIIYIELLFLLLSVITKYIEIIVILQVYSRKKAIHVRKSKRYRVRVIFSITTYTSMKLKTTKQQSSASPNLWELTNVVSAQSQT